NGAMKINANCGATSAAGSWNEPMPGSVNSAACWCVMSICFPPTVPSSTWLASGSRSGGIFETRSNNLLNEAGLVFVSCDDNEIHNLRHLMNEVFGESNFLGCAARVSKKANNQGDYWSPNFDYLVTYAANRDS